MSNWPFLGLRDPISSGSHAVAFFCSVIATLFLIRLGRRQGSRSFSLAVFGSSLMLLYGASATYHALRLTPDGIKFFKLLDHSAIYLLIAGTHAPVFRLLPRTRSQVGLLIAVWSLAVIGVGSEWLLPTPPYWLTVSVYVFMGWLGILALVPLLNAVGLRGVLWIAYGGIAYTAGAFVDLLEWPSLYPRVFGYHELFHFLVMLGSFCHFVFVFRFAVPFGRRHARRLIPSPANLQPEPVAV